MIISWKMGGELKEDYGQEYGIAVVIRPSCYPLLAYFEIQKKKEKNNEKRSQVGSDSLAERYGAIPQRHRFPDHTYHNTFDFREFSS